MIKITKENEKYELLRFKERSYIKRRPIIGSIILIFTRYQRAKNAQRYMQQAQRHLDIGCGDGYLLKRSKCMERYGLDRLLDDEISEHLDFPDEYFDYVTMLAVIEHLPDPEMIFKEVYRILKPGGRFIITTPKRAAECFINIYVKEIESLHKAYFDYEEIKGLCGSMFNIIDYRTFILGLNQVFCLEKCM